MNLKILFLLVLTCLFTKNLLAQWNYNPAQNTPVDTGQNKNCASPAITSDKNGGYFITWERSVPSIYGQEIYAQHLNANGIKMWADPGILICNAPLNQVNPRIISDGGNGAIIVWQDDRTAFSNWDIYAQRVKADGTILWAANGVPVLNTFYDEIAPEIISDGNGGAIIVCIHNSGGGNDNDVYAQRIDGNGMQLWAPGGVAVCNFSNNQEFTKIVSDGNNGVIIAWWDCRNSTTNSVTDIYAQRIDVNGNIMWANNGIPICTLAYDQDFVSIASDNNHGAYIVWEDFRNSTPTTNVADIFAQHINTDGTPLWATNGISVCSAVHVQGAPNVITANDGGMVVGWCDYRSNLPALYAQRFSPGGVPAWNIDGVTVCTTADAHPLNAVEPFLAGDQDNGAFIYWQDDRTGTGKNIYAQHINSNGSPLWPADGAPVCSATGDQYVEYSTNFLPGGSAVADEQGNLVIAWQDGRTSVPDINTDGIYISKISDAILPVTILSVKAYQENDDIRVEWNVAMELNLKMYEIEKSLDGIHFFKTGESLPTGSNLYKWMDVHAVQGNNYFRIKSIDLNGRSKYSRIVKVIMSKNKPGYQVTPNPVINNVINLSLINQHEGIYTIRLLTARSQVILTKQIIHAEGSSLAIISLNNTISKGVYTLQITAPDKTITSIQIVY